MKHEGVGERLKAFIWAKRLRVSHFEKTCGLSNGYVASITKGIGADKMQMILENFPDLSEKWLLTGEGEMLIDRNQQMRISGNGNTQVHGDGNTIDGSGVNEKLINELSSQRQIVEKQQAQLDRLITVIEKLTEK